MNSLLLWIDTTLGLGAEPQKLSFVQISFRGVIVFVAALVMVRLGDRRFLSKKTIFDAILGFILASMLARAVNGSVAFFPTIGAGFVLVGLHKVLAMLALRFHRFGNLVKGKCVQVMKDGVLEESILRKHDLSENDLREDFRLNANIGSTAEAEAAFIERNGQISVIKRKKDGG